MSLKTEPLLTRAAVVAVVAPAVNLAVESGLNLTDGQETALTALLTAAALLVAGWWARQHVTPTSKVSAPPQE